MNLDALFGVLVTAALCALLAFLAALLLKPCRDRLDSINFGDKSSVLHEWAKRDRARTVPRPARFHQLR